MSHLSQVSVYFDDKRLARLTKSAGISKTLELPKGIQKSSRMGIMNVTGVKATRACFQELLCCNDKAHLRISALHITAEVLRWVYSTGSEKPPPPPVAKQTKPAIQGGFFSSIFSTRSAGSTPRRSVINLPAIPADVVDPLTVNETNVVLSIFSADVDVRLDKKIAAELHRSTKKNPPSKLKYELIYVSAFFP
jgi:ribosomal protein L31E